MEFNTRRKIWSAVLFFIVFFFTLGIPISSYNQGPFYISVIGGVLVFIFTFLFISDITSFYELLEKDPEYQAKGLNYAPWALIPGIIFIVIFSLIFEYRKKDVFDKEGIITKGVIINGHSETSRRRGNRTTSFEINVSFQDDKGQEYKFNESINSSEYDKLYNGANIDVKYWKKSPSVAMAILSDEDVKENLKIENRSITLNDLEKIINNDVKKDSVIQYLNSINYKWEQESVGTFLNDNINCIIKLKDDTIIYVESKNKFSVQGMEFKKEFEESINMTEFKKSGVKINGIDLEIYLSDQYQVIKKVINSIDSDKNKALSRLSITKVYTITKRNKKEL